MGVSWCMQTNSVYPVMYHASSAAQQGCDHTWPLFIFETSSHTLMTSRRAKHRIVILCKAQYTGSTTLTLSSKMITVGIISIIIIY